MKILLLADPSSTHTIKWANGLAEKGVDVIVFGLKPFDYNNYNKNIKVYCYQIPSRYERIAEGSLKKIRYLKSLFMLKKVIKSYKPDIVHSHYASSYGLLGVLSKFKPFIISIWGSDIYNFPKISVIHRNIIKFNLRRADKILSTSNVMKNEAKKYTRKRIIVTPFGIDTQKFKKVKSAIKLFSENDFVIGTIKTLEKKYGIEYLIDAFYEVKNKFNKYSLKLLIVGTGSQKSLLEQKVNELGISNSTIFTGFINQKIVHEYHNLIDIYVAPSIEDSESFGVAVLEASSCERPVIVSNVAGFTEIVENNITGIIVNRKNVNSLSLALEKLILNEDLRLNMGKEGRNKVLDNYEWDTSVNRMISIYEQILKN